MAHGSRGCNSATNATKTWDLLRTPAASIPRAPARALRIPAARLHDLGRARLPTGSCISSIAIAARRPSFTTAHAFDLVPSGQGKNRSYGIWQRLSTCSRRMSFALQSAPILPRVKVCRGYLPGLRKLRDIASTSTVHPHSVAGSTVLYFAFLSTQRLSTVSEKFYTTSAKPINDRSLPDPVLISR